MYAIDACCASTLRMISTSNIANVFSGEDGWRIYISFQSRCIDTQACNTHATVTYTLHRVFGQKMCQKRPFHIGRNRSAAKMTLDRDHGTLQRVSKHGDWAHLRSAPPSIVSNGNHPCDVVNFASLCNLLLYSARYCFCIPRPRKFELMKGHNISASALLDVKFVTTTRRVPACCEGVSYATVGRDLLHDNLGERCNVHSPHLHGKSAREGQPGANQARGHGFG